MWAHLKKKLQKKHSKVPTELKNVTFEEWHKIPQDGYGQKFMLWEADCKVLLDAVSNTDSQLIFLNIKLRAINCKYKKKFLTAVVFFSSCFILYYF